MQHVVLVAMPVADAQMAPLAAALEYAGFRVTREAPRADTPGRVEAARADLVIVHVASPVDAEVLSAIARQDGAPHQGLIALLGPAWTTRFDPTTPVDDFAVLPVEPDELLLRVRAVLWRRAGVDSQDLLRLDDLVIDLANYRVTLAGEPVDLTYKEYELLRFLATNRGKVFSRETLLNRVWGYDYYGGARTVDVHIRRLRSKIEDADHAFIETIRNVGYRFAAPTVGAPARRPENELEPSETRL